MCNIESDILSVVVVDDYDNNIFLVVIAVVVSIDFGIKNVTK